ncbi:MAG: nitrite/sulfite reductase [Microthrixaceae bacterium]
MASIDIPAAKRSGLTVDLDRLRDEGDDWLTPEDRFALKTYGACTQLQPHVFMVRIRVPGGVLPTVQARGLARIANRYGENWLHLTTRQGCELHWVADRQVPDVLDDLARSGLSTRSACGHTVRNVMCSEDAGVGIDEPFDSFPDARLISDTLVARSAALNVVLPSRLNFSLGGSPRCRDDALVNDVGLVSIVRDGEAGYEMWAGGSLGKSPSLAVLLAPFVARDELPAAVEALVDVFVGHGDLDTPAKGRMKFLIERLGVDEFRGAFQTAFAASMLRPQPPIPKVDVLDDDEAAVILAETPPGGWSLGVRPQRTAGLATVVIDLPLGDTNSSEFDLFCDLADRFADGHLTLTRDQNISFRNVSLVGVSAIRSAIGTRGLFLLGEGSTAQIRACTGASVCALGITDSPTLGKLLAERPSLRRNSALKVYISGCPNSCAQHQISDIGLAGSKVRVNGVTSDGYQVYLGADLAQHVVGEVVGRVAAGDIGLAVDAVIGTWEALRHHGESLSATVRRLGIESFSNQIRAVLEDRWASGPEQDESASSTPVAIG